MSSLPCFSPLGQIWDREPELILKEFSKVLKIVLLEFAIDPTRRTISHKHVLQLCLYIQEIFMHGLKKMNSLQFLKSMIFSGNSSPVKSPGVSNGPRPRDERKIFTVWDVVQSIICADSQLKIGEGLVNVHTNSGKGMAWIRLALNEGTLEDYVRILVNDRETLNRFYKKEAFLCNMEHAMVFQNFLISLRNVNFGLFVDDPQCDSFSLGGFDLCQNSTGTTSLSQKAYSPMGASTIDSVLDSGIGSNMYSDDGGESPEFTSPPVTHLGLLNDFVNSTSSPSLGPTYHNPWDLNNSSGNATEVQHSSLSQFSSTSLQPLPKYFSHFDHHSRSSMPIPKDSIPNLGTTASPFFSISPVSEDSLVPSSHPQHALWIRSLVQEIVSSAITPDSSNFFSTQISTPLFDISPQPGFCIKFPKDCPQDVLWNVLPQLSSDSPKFQSSTLSNTANESLAATSLEDLSSLSTYIDSFCKRKDCMSRSYDIHMLSPFFSDEEPIHSSLPLSCNSHSISKKNTDNVLSRSNTYNFFEEEEEQDPSNVCPSQPDSQFVATAKPLSHDLASLPLCKQYHENVTRMGKYLSVRGHMFLESHFLKPTCCDECNSIMWGLYKQGFQCQRCLYNCHKSCLKNLFKPCVYFSKATETYSMKICPERNGLVDQQFKCAKCRFSISLAPQLSLPTDISRNPNKNHDGEDACVKEARLCDYTGKYYCSDCHWNDAVIIPARVIHNWDFSPRKVCKESKHFLAAFFNKKFINLQELNPLLFTHILDLQECRNLLQEISFIDDILYRCKYAKQDSTLKDSVGKYRTIAVVVSDSSKPRNRDRGILSDFDILFSLQDLLNIHKKRLIGPLTLLRDAFLDHITVHCPTCIYRAEFLLHGPKVRRFDDSFDCSDLHTPHPSNHSVPPSSTSTNPPSASAKSTRNLANFNSSGLVLSHYLF